MRDNLWRYREAAIIRADPYYYAPGADYIEGLADLLSGERERSLALIARAVDDGYFIPPRDA
jgi:hypothetical protein